MKIGYFYHQSLFLDVQFIKSHCWFRWWLGVGQATSHYLNQLRTSSVAHVCSTKGIYIVDILSPEQNGLHFADDIFTWIFWIENGWHLIEVLPNFVREFPIYKSELFDVLVLLLDRQKSHYLNQFWPSSMTYICVISPQCLKHIVKTVMTL